MRMPTTRRAASVVVKTPGCSSGRQCSESAFSDSMIVALIANLLLRLNSEEYATAGHVAFVDRVDDGRNRRLAALC